MNSENKAKIKRDTSIPLLDILDSLAKTPHAIKVLHDAGYGGKPIIDRATGPRGG